MGERAQVRWSLERLDPRGNSPNSAVYGSTDRWDSHLGCLGYDFGYNVSRTTKASLTSTVCGFSRGTRALNNILHRTHQDAPSRDRGLGKTVWLWPAVLPILVLVYWLTSSVVVATLIPSVIAALPALRTGWWLRAYELSLGCRTRANVLWYFYLADALWQAAASAFVTVVILIIINMRIGIQPDMTKFATAMLTIAGGVYLTTLIGLYAAFYAWRHSIRVWIHPKTHQWTGGVEEKLCLLVFQPQRLNHGVFILGTSLVVPGLLSGTVMLIAITGNGGRMNPAMEHLSLAIMLLYFVALPIVSIIAYVGISGVILARNPSDCWQHTDKNQVAP